MVKIDDGSYFNPDFAYLCPLCKKSVIVYLQEYNQLNWTEEFDLDHFPPESVGGKNTVMVCKKCNSRAGSDYDHMVKEYLVFDAFAKRKNNSKLEAKATFIGKLGRYPINLSFRIDDLVYIELPKKPAPYVTEWLEERKNSSDWQMEVSFNGPSPSKFQKAMLKSAYLYAFSFWGYDFVFSNTGKKIIKVLENIETHPLFNHGVFINHGESDIPLGILLSKTNSVYEGFVVNLEIIDKVTLHKVSVSVLIPGNDLDSWDKLITVQEYIDDKREFQFKGLQMYEDWSKPILGALYKSAWEDFKTNSLKIK